jgi:hypothetical protein
MGDGSRGTDSPELSIRDRAIRPTGGGSIQLKYLLLTYLDEKAWHSLSEAEQQRIIAEPMLHVERLRANGKFLEGAPLKRTDTAATLRWRDGQRLVTDGPFAETREQVGGYTLIDAQDRDEAIAIALGFLGPTSLGTIEVRAVDVAKGPPKK